MLDRHLDAGVTLYTASQIREIEQSYARKFQCGTYPLMEAAGSQAYQLLKQHWPDARKILILTGKGNNGGDGFVIARLAVQERRKVTLCNFCPEESLKGDALQAYNQLPKVGLFISDWEALKQKDLNEFDLIIDAMLGTGIKGAVREPFNEVILRINQHKTPVMAIDVPSGLNADSGNIVNCAVKAEITATFVGHKRGLFTGESANYTGQVKLLTLGVPEDCFQKREFSLLSENWESLKYKLKPRKPTSHKGNHGHCQIIGGADGLTGAVILAAIAAARTGSGLTSARLQSGAASLLARQPEIMAKNICMEEVEEAIAQLAGVNSLVIGPGLGKTDWSLKWMDCLSKATHLQQTNKVWDADALNWLAINPNVDNHRILTPHPGEAARLLGCSTAEINQERFAACESIAKKYGGICVLKGAGTIISDAYGRQTVCAVGNPGMASGGMGDVLSGIIGGLLAQGYSLVDAATLAVCIHGEAADRVAGKKKQYRGILASDCFDYFSALLNPTNCNSFKRSDV